VEDSLKSVNLFNGGVADKQAGKYSGGMKRRLSVAISLIGDPKVCHCLSQKYFFCTKSWDLLYSSNALAYPDSWKFCRLFIWMNPVLD
jgi:hypothetical protein